MHAVKGSWIGQTFALAKSNESGGKKTRIRRSKEERKEMVVSFIKKYQSLNNGSFPTISLTHKEVGGSFYTVREIVRDVIQENRVLGPVKLFPEEHSTDQLLEKYPLGTISVQPCASLTVSPNGSPSTSDQHEVVDEEPDSISDGLTIEAELQGSDSGKVNDGNHIVVNNEELVEQKPEKCQVSESVEAEEDLKEVTVSKALVEKGQVSKSLEAVEDVKEVTVSKVLVEKDQLSESLEAADVKEVTVSKALVEKGQVSELLEAEEDAKEVTVSQCKISQKTDVIVETFPLRPVIKPTDYFDGNSDGLKDLNRTSEEENAEKVHLAPGNDIPSSYGTSSSNKTFFVNGEVDKLTSTFLEKNYDSMNDKLTGNLANPICSSTSKEDLVFERPQSASVEKISDLVDEKSGKILVEILDPTLEGSNPFTTKEVIVHEESTVTLSEQRSGPLDDKSLENPLNPTLKTSNSAINVAQNTQLDFNVETVSESKIVNTNALEAKPLDDTYASSKAGGQDVVVDSKNNGQLTGNEPTLSRINQKSCEETSGNPGEPETNPILAVFKSFIAAFMKFFSE